MTNERKEADVDGDKGLTGKNEKRGRERFETVWVGKWEEKNKQEMNILTSDGITSPNNN